MQAQKTVLVVGGTSDIGRAAALHYAQAGWRVLLAARDQEGARRNAQDIAARTGVEVEVLGIDILETERLQAFVDSLPTLPDTVVSVVGELGDQARGQADPGHASQVFRANFEGPALLLGLFAERFRPAAAGALVGVSSVAGDRGRGSNYLYGAAKAGFTAFLSVSGTAVQHRRAGDHREAGFRAHPHDRRDETAPVLTAEPDEVGRAIFAAAEKGGGDVIYVRRVWRMVMAIISGIPSLPSSGSVCSRWPRPWPTGSRAPRSLFTTREPRQRWNADPVRAILVAMVVVGALLLGLPGQTVTTKYLDNLFIILDGASRVMAGQAPGRDFHTPLGPLAFYVPAAGYWLSGSLGGAMPIGTALLMVALAPAMAHVLGSRLHPFVALPLGGFLVLVPRGPGQPRRERDGAVLRDVLQPDRLGGARAPARHVSPAAAGAPAAGRPRRRAAAFLTLVMIYTKVTYGAVAVAFLLFLLLDPRQRRWARAGPRPRARGPRSWWRSSGAPPWPI
jgi:short-subunit dehydrogenase